MNCFKCDQREARQGRLLCDRCQALEIEATRRKALTPSQRAYEDALGVEACERQTRLAREHFPCCGEHRAGPHHEMCKHFVADAAPAVHEAQEALL